MSPVIRIALLLLPTLFFASTAGQAQEMLPGLTLRAAIGGAVPFAQRDSYVVANLVGPDNRFFALSSAPFQGSQIKSIFDSRPQLMLGGGLPLMHFGEAKLSLNAVVSAGATPAPDEPRPVLGLAGLRLVF